MYFATTPSKYPEQRAALAKALMPGTAEHRRSGIPSSMPSLQNHRSRRSERIANT